MRRLLYRIRFVLGAILILIFGFVISSIFGREFTFTPIGVIPEPSDVSKYTVEPEAESKDYVEVTGCGVNSNGELTVSIKSKKKNVKKPKSLYLSVKLKDAGSQDGYSNTLILFVHRNGVITVDDYYGKTGGARITNTVWFLYILFILLHFVTRYRTSIKKSMYQYKNILFLGLILYLIYASFVFFTGVIEGGGLIDQVNTYTDSMAKFSIVTSPIVLILTVAVTITNTKLMIKESFNWRNMLGTFLGIVLLIGIFLPEIVYATLSGSDIIDIHNWTGTGRFITEFISLMSTSIVTYIECILFGTIIVSVKASRHIPRNDMDYILILGCMIKKDGTLTKLLKGRADRAIEYSKLQKTRSDHDIVFVPSGGQGSDEVMAEGDAIRNYLVGEGIDDEHILVENKSTNTDQNFALSYKLINEHYYKTHDKESKPDIAFSTTNYHVFRSGMLASSKGITAEGVGAKTVSYFWINAFIREFIATLVAEKKVHILVIGTLTAANALSIIFTYISNVILSSPM